MKTNFTKILIILFVGLQGLANAQQFEVRKIKNSGSNDSKVNIAILADGYTSSQLNKFWNDAQTVVTGVFSEYPFSGLSSSYNVFAVGAVSNQTGAGTSPSNKVDNYFGSTFYADGVTQRLLYPSNSSRVWSVAASHVPTYDVVLVMVNTTTYGGAGGAFACISTHSSAIDLFLHEYGHTFAGLIDEYWYRGQEGPNMTQNYSNPRWSQYIGQSGVGVYPYEENTSWYRPHQNCKMRYLAGDFDLVCGNTLINKTNDLVGGGCSAAPATPEGLTAQGNTVSWNAQQGVTNYNLLRWTGSEWVTAATPATNSATLGITGTYYFTVSASNECGTSGYSSYQLLTLSNGLAREAVEDEVDELNIYPNPVDQKLHVDLKSSLNATEIKLYNLNGEVVVNQFVTGMYRIEMDLNAISAGVYIIKVFSDDQVISKKIVKQ